MLELLIQCEADLECEFRCRGELTVLDGADRLTGNAGKIGEFLLGIPFSETGKANAVSEYFFHENLRQENFTVKKTWLHLLYVF